MSAKPIRIAVAGLGRIGWHFHCGSIAKHKEFRLAAVADPEAARREEAVAAHGCAAFADFDEMLRRTELDAVVVATPTHLHKAHALAAFRRGLHVYLEKPMAPDLSEARAIVAAAKRSGRVLTVYQPNRAAAWFQHLCRIVRSGQIGRPFHVRSGLYNYSRRNDWQSLRRFGGGMLNNYGAHALDQALHLTGPDVARVFCNLRRVASLGDAEDVVKIVYETRSGILGEVDINQACALPPRQFEVFGTQGAVAMINRKQLLARWFDPRALAKKSLNKSLASADRKYPLDDIPFKEELIDVEPRFGVDVYKDLARAIRTGAAPFVKPEETLAVMKTIAACRESARRIVATPL